jgi:hypothetical protein
VQDLLRPCDILPSARLKLLVDRSIEIDIDIAESKSLKWVNHVTCIRVIFCQSLVKIKHGSGVHA